MHRLLLAIAFVVFAACGSSDEPAVSMTTDHTFDPSSLSVASGTEVVFTNDGDEPHTVTAYSDGLPDGAAYFSSGGFDDEASARDGLGDSLIPPGEQYTVTLDEPGTYRYFCIPHENHGMTGEIIVE